MKVIFKNAELIFQKSAREDFVFTNGKAININGEYQNASAAGTKATEGYTEINDGNINKTIFNVYRRSAYTVVGVAMYNSSKNFLGYYNPDGDNDLVFNVAISTLLTQQPNTKYIRVTAKNSETNCFIGVPEE